MALSYSLDIATTLPADQVARRLPGQRPHHRGTPTFS